MSLGKMKFRDFEWPHNPATCNLIYDKRIIKHEFPDINGAEIEELGTEPRIISGSGIFFGKNAYSNWAILGRLFNDGKVGVLWHPKWGTFSRMNFTKLVAKEEPLPDYIEYDYEFIEHTPISSISRIVDNGWLLDGDKWYYFKNGLPVKNDWAKDAKGLWYYLGYDGVMMTNHWIKWKSIWYYLKSSGAMAANEWLLWENKWYFLKSSGAMAVSEWILWKGTNYYLGSDGVWDEKADSSKVTTTTSSNTAPKTSPPSSNIKYHTVVSGDTLASISKKYYGNANDWRKIADANKNLIKNPNVIQVGWKLIIP